VKRWGVLLCAVAAAAGESLYNQSVARLLEARFVDGAVSYLLLDAHTGTTLAERWDDPGPAAAGSLVKPFTALAYGEGHGFRFPERECRGKADGCWLTRGHGRIGIVEAIAQSCNVYFRALASAVESDDVAAVARRFGLPEPDQRAGAAALAGLGDGWRIPPSVLARAYCGLAADPEAEPVRRGMALSALEGTGRAAGAGLVKTGTAACVHRRKARNDGFAMVLDPAGGPEYALLVRVHGVSGAEAAAVAGRMMRVIREGR
jgi:cell division protein FtsI/penicillin-binding protein 2